MEAKRDQDTSEKSSEVRSATRLERLLERRGIVKNEEFGDYQDYIEEAERGGLKSRVIASSRVVSEGSMHLALGRTVSTKKFRY
jgi:hypothetical protein